MVIGSSPVKDNMIHLSFELKINVLQFILYIKELIRCVFYLFFVAMAEEGIGKKGKTFFDRFLRVDQVEALISVNQPLKGKNKRFTKPFI